MREQTINFLIEKTKKDNSKDYNLIKIPDFLAKRIVAYSGMKRDLEQISEFILELKKEPSSVISQSLIYSLIALYGKCFTDATKQKNPKLEPSKVYLNHKKFNELHIYLMDLRHNFIAHRGQSNNEIGIFFMAISKNKTNSSKMIFEQLKLSKFSREKIEILEKMINYLIKYVNKLIDKHIKKTQTAFFDNYNNDEIYKMLL